MTTRAGSPGRVDAASTIDEVVAAVRDFVEGLSTRDLDRLPRFNRPGGIDDADAVHRWAEQLSRYERPPSQDPVNSALFDSMRECFTRASGRIAEVSNRTRAG